MNGSILWKLGGLTLEFSMRSFLGEHLQLPGAKVLGRL
jgi:hypothetical protein